MLNRMTRWKPRPIAENKIFAAAIAIVSVGAAQGILNHFDVFGSKAMTELLAFLVCVWLFPNEPGRKWTFPLGLSLVTIGLLGGGNLGFFHWISPEARNQLPPPIGRALEVLYPWSSDKLHRSSTI